MTALLVIVLALVLLDIAVLAGWTHDSRDGRDWWRQEWPSQRSRPDVPSASDGGGTLGATARPASSPR